MFFAPPKRIDADIFARLPDALRTGAEDNEWVRGQPVGMPHRSMLERPSFDRDGNLWCVDIVNGRVLRVAPAGAFSVVAEYDGWANGLKIHRDGRVFIADSGERAMLRARLDVPGKPMFSHQRVAGRRTAQSRSGIM